jgi:hypothetical protein
MEGEKSNRRLLYSERVPGRMYDMYEAPTMDIYVDGAGRIFTGVQVTKIRYFRTVGMREEDSLSFTATCRQSRSANQIRR